MNSSRMAIEPEGWQHEPSLPIKKRRSSYSSKSEKVHTVAKEHHTEKKQTTLGKRSRSWQGTEHIKRESSVRASRRFLSRKKTSIRKGAKLSHHPGASKSKGHTKKTVTLDVVKKKLERGISEKQIHSLFRLKARHDRPMEKLHDRYEQVFASAQSLGPMNEKFPGKILEFSVALEQFQAGKISFDECVHALREMKISDQDLLFFVTQFLDKATLSSEARGALENFLRLVESRKNWAPKIVPSMKDLLEFSVCTFYKVPNVVAPIFEAKSLVENVIEDQFHPTSVLIDAAGATHVITPLKIGKGAFKLASLAVKLEKVAHKVLDESEIPQSIKPSLEVGLEYLPRAETNAITQNTISFLSKLDDVNSQFAQFLVDTHYVDRPKAVGGSETVLFSEFCQGDLFGWLSSEMQKGVKVNNPSNLLQLLLALHHVARGFQVVHGLGCTHWDGRLENFFLLSDKPGEFPMIKLGDYDFVGPKEKLRGVYGTYNTSAPELFQNLPIQDTQKLDVWAFGIIFYALFIRGFPVFSERINNFARHKQGALPTQKDIDTEIDKYFATIHIDSCKQELEALVRLLKSIFNVDPQKRPDIGTILNSLIGIMSRLKTSYQDDSILGPALKLTELSTAPEAIKK